MGARGASLVGLDPELFDGLEPRELGRMRAVEAPVVELGVGAWRPQLGARGAGLGLLVVDGVLVRRVAIGADVATEIVGAGDLLRPWEAGEEDGTLVASAVHWFVLEPARLAVLGRHVAGAAADCPGLVAALVERTARRSRSQGILVAIAHTKRIDLRVLLLLWHLAERWGRVTPAGVVVPIRLTHERIASIVGAQRPSVTAALSRLGARALVARTAERGFLLTPAAYDELQLLCHEGERAVAPLMAVA